MNLKLTLATTSLVAILALTGCEVSSSASDTPSTNSSSQVKDLPTAQKEAVIQTALTAYADYAFTSYSTAKIDAIALQTALRAFTATPTETTLATAKTAWLKSRESYGITEALRLSEGPIDAEAGYGATFDGQEGQINAWPLDENYIDYTTDKNNNITSGNIIDGTATITKASLAALNEVGGDTNVATGYHAIEFLLWGQDQDYNSFVADNITSGPMVAGARPLTDYTTADNADRRKTYLNAVADLLVDDLTTVVNAWGKGGDTYRDALLGTHSTMANNLTQNTALKQIFAGIGVFIKSELANERIAVAALTPSEEDEHSCFSDNTHRDIVLNYEGFKNVLNIFKDNLSTAEQTEVNTQMASIDAKVKIINDVAISDYHFDHQIIEANGKLQNIINTKNEMRDLGDEIVAVAAEYGINISTSDVTDSEETSI
ncbi:MAG: Iron-regulated protein A precursor [uncultured Sulfurovum sp.]|uniref:Iron-regulated protein A n=1 Tax=uncultured Sulfurovum sp. TaxID=269237 RepID=A0A6S6S6G2_9BACT|nr:MAG: Iron-regulated protein A precursor [uncultured Sulfurovum sp.]